MRWISGLRAMLSRWGWERLVDLLLVPLCRQLCGQAMDGIILTLTSSVTREASSQLLLILVSLSNSLTERPCQCSMFAILNSNSDTITSASMCNLTIGVSKLDPSSLTPSKMLISSRCNQSLMLDSQLWPILLWKWFKTKAEVISMVVFSRLSLTHFQKTIFISLEACMSTMLWPMTTELGLKMVALLDTSKVRLMVCQVIRWSKMISICSMVTLD